MGAMRSGVVNGIRVPGRTYRFVSDEFFVYPFGHGMSYTQWDFAWTDSTRAETDGTWSCRVSVEVKSKVQLTRPQSVSVLLFLRPPSSSDPSAPVKQLRAFERVRFDSVIDVKPTRSIEFT